MSPRARPLGTVPVFSTVWQRVRGHHLHWNFSWKGSRAHSQLGSRSGWRHSSVASPGAEKAWGYGLFLCRVVLFFPSLLGSPETLTGKALSSLYAEYVSVSGNVATSLASWASSPSFLGFLGSEGPLVTVISRAISFWSFRTNSGMPFWLLEKERKKKRILTHVQFPF